MIYGAESNIIQANDHLYLWAFLTDNTGNRLANEEVSFYKIKGDVETQIGSSVVTNSKGIASLDYVGGGVGQIGILAKYGSVQSNTYEVLDCTVLDDGTSASNSKWSVSSGVTINRNYDGYSAFEKETTNNLYITSTATLSESSVIEVDAKLSDNADNSSALCEILDGSNNRLANFLIRPTTCGGTKDWTSYQIYFSNSKICVKNRVSGTVGQSNSYTGTPTTLRLVMYSGQNRIYFKNFKVYPSTS